LERAFLAMIMLEREALVVRLSCHRQVSET